MVFDVGEGGLEGGGAVVQGVGVEDWKSVWTKTQVRVTKGPSGSCVLYMVPAVCMSEMLRLVAAAHLKILHLYQFTPILGQYEHGLYIFTAWYMMKPMNRLF